MRLHFLDTESTGLDVAAGVELTEVAIVLWEDGNVTELFERPFIPRRGCPENVARINGYDESLWREAGAKHFGIADARDLQRLLEGAYVAGSNPDFDKRMISAEHHRCGAPAPAWSHRSLNTASLAWPLWALGEVEGTGLGTLSKYFGIEHDAHSAIGDCRAAIKVWEALFDLYIHKPRVMREALQEIAADSDSAEYRMLASNALGL